MSWVGEKILKFSSFNTDHSFLNISSIIFQMYDKHRKQDRIIIHKLIKVIAFHDGGT